MRRTIVFDPIYSLPAARQQTSYVLAHTWLDLPSAGEEKLMPKLGELTKLATKPDEVYSGNRVYDEM